MGKFLSQYKNILEANKSNQNCYGLWEYRLLQNFIQKTKHFATIQTIHTYICS